MRFFIALEIPEENKKQLLSIQEEVKKIIPELSLTFNEKLHLTIAFIGEKEAQLKEDLIAAMEEAIKDISAFSVTPSLIDGFPNIHTPNTVWIGVKGDTDKLHFLRERVKDQLLDLGLEVDERRYVPHIAIGKLKNISLSEDQERALEELMLKNNFDSIKVTSVKLFESVADEGFHKHNTLAEVRLH